MMRLKNLRITDALVIACFIGATGLVSSHRGSLAQSVTTLVTGPALFDDALSFDRDGNLVASYYYGGRVSRISPGGVVSRLVSGLVNPNGSTVGADGELYVAEAGADRILKVALDRTFSVHLSDIDNPTGLVFDDEGNLYIAQYELSQISKMDTAGTVTVLMTGQGLNGPAGLQMDGGGNLYIANFTDGRILKRASAGTMPSSPWTIA